MAIENVIAVRGAITIDSDTPEQIVSSTTELIGAIVEANGIGTSCKAVSCIISSTADVTAFYPARAIRESGLLSCPLFSCLEPPIKGSLPFCIRVMIELVGEVDTVKHIYLHGASTLRPDLIEPKEGTEMQTENTEAKIFSENAAFNVAIDGPSGAGKSTVAKILARKTGMTYLDTGAMYRAIGLKMHRSGVRLDDTATIIDTLAKTQIEVETANGVQHVLLDGKDVSDEIRRHYVSKLASDFSAVKEVRLKLVEMQREIASSKDCILDGRDIGTFVLPDAAVKFYLTASVDVRAKRRYDELTAKGEACDLQQIKQDIKQRDYNDMHRDFAPLKKADDSIEVVTDDMTVDQVVAYMNDIIKDKRA